MISMLYPRPVNSGVGLRFMSEPRAVATGSLTQLGCEVSTIRVSGWVKHSTSVARFAGLGFLGDVIPGLRSLRSLTRGYYLSSLRDSLTQTSNVEYWVTWRYSLQAQP